MVWNTSTGCKIILCGIFFLMIIFSVYAEDTDAEIEEAETPETNTESVAKTGISELENIISLDANFTMAALRNNGFGVGVNYERKLTDFLSIRPGIGSMVFFSEVTIVTVNLQLFFYYYPLSNGLDKLYVGLGNGFDFIIYTNDIPNDKIYSLTPVLGWKWRALRFLIIEPFVGWKFYLVKTKNYDEVDKYLNEGFQWGLNFKLLFQKLIKG